MDANFERAVRERAYALWIEAGMVHGMDRLHWLTAEVAVKRVAQPGKASVASAAARPEPVQSTPAKATTKAVAAKKVGQKAAVAGASAKASKGGSKVAAEVAGKSGVSTTASRAAPSHLAN